MATNASEAHNQTNAQLKSPTPRPIAACGAMRPRARTSLNSHAATAAQTPPTTKNLSRALPSSETPRRPNSRLRPANGLRREKSGVSARGLKFQPPSNTEDSNTSPTSAPNTGNTAITALVPASPSDAAIESVLRNDV